MSEEFVLTPSSKVFAEKILTMIETKELLSDRRVLFFNGAYNFPFLINEIGDGSSSDHYILVGVAETPGKRRHYAQIEFSLSLGCGRFLH